MTKRSVLFDCAMTLVEVDYSAEIVARDALRRLGRVALDAETARYGSLLRSRWAAYGKANETRDEVVVRAFWHHLGADWLRSIGASEVSPDALYDAADDILFGPASVCFQRYDDVVPTLERLRGQGLALAVVSNWDMSLSRVLRHVGLDGYFDVAIASLMEGVEKPEPDLFNIALERLDLPAADCIHVGDNPVDDVEGARRAGIDAILLDRSGQIPFPSAVKSLAQITDHPAWT